MPVNSAERPGSSQGRGGNTQKEQSSLSNRGPSLLVEQSTEGRQPFKKQPNRIQNANPTAEALNILEEVLSTVNPNLAECEIVRIIS